MVATFFLRLPTGVAIETHDFADEADLQDSLNSAGDFLSVTRRRDQATLIIPIDNIASIELR